MNQSRGERSSVQYTVWIDIAAQTLRVRDIDVVFRREQSIADGYKGSECRVACVVNAKRCNLYTGVDNVL